MKNLDYKDMGGSIVLWKIDDASSSFEVSRGFNGRPGIDFVEGAFTEEEFKYGIALFKGSSAESR